MRHSFCELSSKYHGWICAHRFTDSEPQFTFAKNPSWSHFYSYAEEIWDYFRNVVDQYELRKHMKLNHEVVGAYWDEVEGRWDVHVKDLLKGTTFIDYAHIFINGSGLLKSERLFDVL
jgi:cation diffusion facilitator CzcD-associated flavoprotein CzcO